MKELRDKIAMFFIWVAFKIMTTEALDDIHASLVAGNWHRRNK